MLYKYIKHWRSNPNSKLLQFMIKLYKGKNLSNNKTMKISLIISTYNRPEALRLSLMSAKVQTRIPDEVIIADDGSKENTSELIKTSPKIFHVQFSMHGKKIKAFAWLSQETMLFAWPMETILCLLTEISLWSAILSQIMSA